MKKTYLPLLVLMLLAACEKEDYAPAISDTDQTIESRSKAGKITVCHYSKNREQWKLIDISPNKWAVHEAHGDVRLDDQDGDGFVPDNVCGYGEMGDCDDQNAAVNPAATEVCDNSVDDDCDGEVDETDSDCPGSSIDNLLWVTLPNGQTLYVHPTVNEENIPWGPYGNNITSLSDINDTDKAIVDFNGEYNTQAIVSELGNYNEGYYAAKLCEDLVAFGFEDWYLPAAGELKVIHDRLGPEIIGGSGDIIGSYWSSSEFSEQKSWVQHIAPNTSLAHEEPTIKENYRDCRCVRK